MSATVPSDDEVFAAFPGVQIDRDNVAHYRGLLQGRLLINRCAGCGWWIYPHRPLCPQCLSWQVTPQPVSGRGTVFMYTLIHQERDPEGQPRAPVIAAAVELAEQRGLRYLARIVHCPPERLALDMAVSLCWIDDGGRRMPAFEPARGS